MLSLLRELSLFISYLVPLFFLCLLLVLIITYTCVYVVSGSQLFNFMPIIHCLLKPNCQFLPILVTPLLQQVDTLSLSLTSSLVFISYHNLFTAMLSLLVAGTRKFKSFQLKAGFWESIKSGYFQFSAHQTCIVQILCIFTGNWPLCALF